MTTKAAGAQGDTDSAGATRSALDQPAADAKAAADKEAADKAAADTKAAADKEAADKAAAEGQKDEGAKKGGKDDKAEAESKAPDKYTLAIPDDGKAYLDDVVLKSIEKMARESGWSNEDAQNAVNEHALALRRADETFLTELKADATYGGDNLVETQKLAKSIIDLGRPVGHARREAFLRTINRVAAANNIEFVSFLADLGKLVGEDRPGLGGSGAGTPKTAAQVLYNNTPEK